MKTSTSLVTFLIVGVAAMLSLTARSLAQEYPDYGPVSAAPPVAAAESDEPELLTDEQLDQLLAPVALYPDSLLAQLLPAATYPMEVVVATQWLKDHPEPDEQAIDDQDWDVSVKAMAHYPAVLETLAAHAEWTQSLGAAFLNQQGDVMASVQRLRQQAMDAQNLQSTPEQQIIQEDGDIEILPTDPEVVYVPQYDPTIIYVRHVEQRPIVFSVRLRIGKWLDNGFDWRRHYLAVGGGWHYGWEFSDRKWRRDDRVLIRPNPRDFDRRIPDRDRGRDVVLPTIRPWSHNSAKPRPHMPPALVRHTVQPDRGGRVVHTPTPEAVRRPAGPARAFDLPPRRMTAARDVTKLPPRGGAAFGSDQSRDDVRRAADRGNRSRSALQGRSSESPEPVKVNPTIHTPTLSGTSPTRRPTSAVPATVFDPGASVKDTNAQSNRGRQSLDRGARSSGSKDKATVRDNPARTNKAAVRDNPAGKNKTSDKKRS